MKKSEIIYTDNDLELIQKAKDIYQKKHGGIYISLEQFIKTAVIIQSNSIIENERT